MPDPGHDSLLYLKQREYFFVGFKLRVNLSNYSAVL